MFKIKGGFIPRKSLKNYFSNTKQKRRTTTTKKKSNKPKSKRQTQTRTIKRRTYY
jgi:hypothetical protein